MEAQPASADSTPCDELPFGQAAWREAADDDNTTYEKQYISNPEERRERDTRCCPVEPQIREQQLLLNSFSQLLDREARLANFTCGGKLPIGLADDGRTLQSGELTPIINEKFDGHRLITKGVSVRWGPEGSGRIVTMPATNDDERTKLDQLVTACSPATFGRGGEDVYDETYRRALALGVDAFMTDFCPYEAGIVAIIEQYLVPSLCGDLESTAERSALAMEHDLSEEEEFTIHQLASQTMLQDGQLVYIADLPPFLEALQILPPDDEMLRIMRRLDTRRDGMKRKADVLDIACRRLKEAQQTPGHKIYVGPQDNARIRSLGLKDRERMMTSRSIRAELYKLNVYSGPSGHFKPHVDTPRSDVQVGSLIVCLPVSFEGGALSVRHSGREVLYKWGTAEPVAVRWAAFYSDCEHEVHEVTSGNRVTLTYNLFLAPCTGFLTSMPKPLDIGSVPMFGHLRKMLATPNFFPSGGFLGIRLTHSYPHTHEKTYQLVPRMLKGGDMALYESVAALGLVAALEPVVGGDIPSETLLDDLDELSSKPGGIRKRQHFISRLQEHKVDLDGYDEAEIDVEAQDDERLCMDSEDTENEDNEMYQGEYVQAARARLRARGKITWLGDSRHKEMSRTWMAYGNNAELKVTYSYAAIVVKIPRWSKRQAAGLGAQPSAQQ